MYSIYLGVFKYPTKLNISESNFVYFHFRLFASLTATRYSYSLQFKQDNNSNISNFLNLSYDGGFTDLSFNGGGLKVPPPFLFVKTIEKVIRLCTVLKKKILDWQF